MSDKLEKLKPRVIECSDRLRKLIDLGAPGVIIGAEAWHLFCTVLAAYGTGAASTMVQDIRYKNLHGRGVCSNEDCTAYVERPDIGVCKPCREAMGIPADAKEIIR